MARMDQTYQLGDGNQLRIQNGGVSFIKGGNLIREFKDCLEFEYDPNIEKMHAELFGLKFVFSRQDLRQFFEEGKATAFSGLPKDGLFALVLNIDGSFLREIKLEGKKLGYCNSFAYRPNAYI